MTNTAQPRSQVLHHREPHATTMRAVVIERPGKAQVRHVPLPEPVAGQVRVRLEGCGVCASNVPPWDGRPWFNYPLEPGQLGHEGWGRVDMLGPDVEGLAVDDRVAFLSNNAYAQFDVAAAETVVKLPGELDGQPMPAEPLGCAMNVMHRSGIGPGQTVAIVGIGFLGALLTRLASEAGARVVAVTRRPSGLALAREMGAADTVPMESHGGVLERVSALSEGTMCDVVIEATGAQWPLDLAGELTRERGRLVVAGYHQDGARQVNMQLWNWRGLDVINAHERDPAIYRRGMEQAVAAVAEGRLAPGRLYTHRFGLDTLDKALNLTRDRADGFMKALVIM